MVAREDLVLLQQQPPWELGIFVNFRRFFDITAKSPICIGQLDSKSYIFNFQ